MGRRSEIEAEARKSGSVVTSVSVGGAAANIASGEIEVPRPRLCLRPSKSPTRADGTPSYTSCSDPGERGLANGGCR